MQNRTKIKKHLSYSQRASEWSTVLYRFAYDAAASIIGALPRGFLKPFEFIAQKPFEERLIQNESVIRGLQFAILPLIDIIEFYIQKPFANTAGILAKLISYVIAPFLALIRMPPSYPEVTAKNLYFSRIAPGPFGQLVNRYASFGVWGALFGIGIGLALPELALAIPLENLMLQGLSAFAFVGGLFGLSTRLMYEHGRNILTHIQYAFSVLNKGLSALTTAIVDILSFCKTALAKNLDVIWDFTTHISTWVAEQSRRFGTWFNTKFEAAIELIRKGPKAIWDVIKDKTIGAIMRYGTALMTAHQLPLQYATALTTLRMKHANVFTEAKATEMIDALRSQAAKVYRTNGIQAKIDFLTQELAKINALENANELEICTALNLPLSEEQKAWKERFPGDFGNYQNLIFSPSADEHRSSLPNYTPPAADTRTNSNPDLIQTNRL